MDEITEQLLARYEHRATNARELHLKADSRRSRAEEIERQLALPDHQRPVGHEETLALEAQQLRQEADALARDADGIMQRLHQPSDDLARRFEEWGRDDAQARDRNRDRDRGGHNR